MPFRRHRPTTLAHGKRASLLQRVKGNPLLTLTLVSAALVATAVMNRKLAKKAEDENPPQGRFITVEGVRLHYIERGSGPVLVLLHGNGSMIQDFLSSGLLDEAALSHRVIVFDRPGFGHSDRPRRRLWTPDAQAKLIHDALMKLGVGQATVFGHSWGASVAVALGLRYPRAVKALILASGYYYPTARVDVWLLSGPAIPVLGDVLRYTLVPLIARLAWPLIMRKIFGPAVEPPSFARDFPAEMALRPSQIRASAEESALMVPNALRQQKRYSELEMPVTIIAGAHDRVIDTQRQSGRLHAEIRQSILYSIPGAGHMVHHAADPRVLTAIAEARASTHAA